LYVADELHPGEKFFVSLPKIDFSGVNRLPAASRSNDPGVGTAAMFGGFPPATAASSNVGKLDPPLRTVTFIPVFASKGFSAVAKPVASAPENSFHTDTDPPILDEALATVFTPIADTEAIRATAPAMATARFPKYLLVLKFPPTHNSSTALVPLVLSQFRNPLFTSGSIRKVPQGLRANNGTPTARILELQVLFGSPPSTRFLPPQCV
jgi:hypothetical protein